VATGKITKRSVDAVVAPSKGSNARAYLWDEDVKGFGLMVTDKGHRSYILQYRIGGRAGQTRRVTIGRHGSPWTPESARKRALELLEQVRRRIDPFDAERDRLRFERERHRLAAEAEAAATTLAFSTFADRFIDRYAKIEQSKTWRDTDSIFRRDLKPYFQDKPLPSIQPPDIIRLLDRVHERGDSAAIKAYKALRVMFAWAVEKHELAASPMQNMKPPAKIAPRERALTDAELRLVWLAANGLGWPFGPIIQLLILTGQRRDEVAGLRWPELDFTAKQWLLPAYRSKNEEENLVPLAPMALSILKASPRVESKAKLLFTTTGETPVSGFSKIKRRLDDSMLKIMRQEAAKAGASDEDLASITLESWRIHDLRRTLATGCQRLGVPLEVSEAILNHASGTRSGIAGVYHVYRFETEKRNALQAWAHHVADLVGPDGNASLAVGQEAKR
jgi:integrase